MSNYKYLHIKNMQVFNANAEGGFYTLGLPDMTGTAGYGHVIQRHLNLSENHNLIIDPDELPVDSDDELPLVKGFMLIIHDMQFSEGHCKHSNSQHTSINKGAVAATIDKRTVHLKFDLIFQIDEQEMENNEKLMEYFKSPEFKNYLISLPFCGGTLHRDNLAVFYYGSEETMNDMFAKRKISPHSFIIEDAVSVMEKSLHKIDDSTDSLDLLLANIKRYREKKSASQDKPEQSYRPFYIPLGVGFMGLEQPQERKQISRFGHPHVLCESVIGLGRVRSVASYRKHISEGLPVWWQYAIDAENNLYILKGKKS